MKTLVLIAASGADAAWWQKDHLPVFDGRVVVVTPRAPQAARGLVAFAVLATSSARALPSFDALVADAAPAVATQVLR